MSYPTRAEGLVNMIKTQLIHGPCGVINLDSPCMQDKNALSDIQKLIFEKLRLTMMHIPFTTDVSQKTGENQQVRGEEINLVNQWVESHNKLLCKILKAHINMEYCSSMKAIKYITKYVNKVSDMATFAIGDQADRDEMKNYPTGRYISSNEAIRRNFGLEIHQRYPTVVVLLENGQRVYFAEDTAHNLA